MKRLLLLLLLLTTPVFAATDYTYPDKNLTPGMIDATVTQDTIKKTICVPGYTATVRNVPQIEKIESLHNYLKAYPDWPACAPEGKVKCEYDHFISLELGGANNINNLWPQAWCIDKKTAGISCFGAHEKDVVENYLHKQVCAGKISLRDAQNAISIDWVRVYKKIKGK